MTIQAVGPAPSEPRRGALLYDPKFRGLVAQALLLALVVFAIWTATSNAVDNLRARGIASGFEFLSRPAGFDVSQTLVPFSSSAGSYGTAFVVGLLNTLLVAALGIIGATLLGFVIGIARLSPNWIVARLATVYVEVIRNTPLLLQLVFWYSAVLKPLPEPRNSIAMAGLRFDWFGVGAAAVFAGIVALAFAASRRASTHALRIGVGLAAVAVLLALHWLGFTPFRATDGGVVFLNNRGLYLPSVTAGAGAGLVGWSALAGLVAAIGFRVWARREQLRTGRQFRTGFATLGFVVGVPLLVWSLVMLASGNPLVLGFPEQQRFNLRGGLQVYPEFVALLLGLVIYTAAFIAEVVRAGILAVSKGQTEAASALGLRPGPVMNLVIIPQAMRVIIPPLTSQYLNLTKNSSLAVAIGYPDLVQVFTGTVLNQTGQAIEVVAITMAVYLTLSLLTSAIMNWFNARRAIVER